jgi:hypothetical protein
MSGSLYSSDRFARRAVLKFDTLNAVKHGEPLGAQLG